MKKSSILTFILILTLTFSLVSCGAGSYYDSDMNAVAAKSESYYDGGYAEEAEAPDPSFGASDAPKAPESGSASNDRAARKIIRTANLNFETTEYDKFISSVSSCVAAHGGYFESTDSYGSGIYSKYDERSASMTIRIPVDRYDAFMDAVSGIGALTHRSESESDVTMTYVDIESRIRALETEHETLLEILNKAESLTDVIQLQSRISEVNYQLDSMKSQIRKYDDLIAYCTINLYVREVWRETVPNEKKLTFGERIGVGLRENLRDIGERFEDFAVWFVTSLPSILIWCAVVALIVLLIRLIVKKYRKHKEKKLLDAYLKSTENEKKEKEVDHRA